MRKNHLSVTPSYLLWLLPLALLILAGCEPLPEPEAIPAIPTEGAPALAEAGLTAPPLAYPPPAETLAPYPEPWLTASPTVDGYPAPGDGTATLGAVTEAATAEPVYFPIIGEGASPVAETPLRGVSPGAALTTATPTAAATATATPSPTATPLALAAGPTPTPTPFAPLDFESVRADLAGQAQELVHNKIGLHVTFPENNKELDTYMQRLDEAGVPFFLKSVDNAEPIYRAQELMKASGVDHTLVFRSTKYDVPDYTADPVAAADYYWELEKETWPPELDPSLVWFETMNEVDRNESEWLAQFSLRTAELALRDGYKWAAFGWASGEPEPEAWRAPAMLEFLRLVSEHPDQLAIALHEYSYLADDIGHDYPYKVGRFLDLFRAADENDFPRPTVLITEWGWTYNNIPPEPDAMADVEWAAELYGAFPQIKGAAIWNLGKLDDTILPLNRQVGDLVDSLMVFSLNRFFTAPVPPAQTTTDAAQFPPPPN